MKCALYIGNITSSPERAKKAGGLIVKLMRSRQVTIRDLAAKMDVTMSRVRQVRNNGPETELIYMDYKRAIIS